MIGLNLKKHKKRLIITCLTVLILGVCAVFGIMAYLTNADSVSNTLNVGNVKIKLSEPNYSQPDEKLVPAQTISKNPVITNIGKNDAVVFMKITVPVRNVKTVSDNGTTVKNAEPLEVFTFKSGENSGFNSNWFQLSETKETEKNTYVFGYNKKISKDEKTVSLFDSVTFINVLEGQIKQDSDLDIGIFAYGVQADGIKDNNDNPIDTNVLDENTLKTIYESCLIS